MTEQPRPYDWATDGLRAPLFDLEFDFATETANPLTAEEPESATTVATEEARLAAAKAEFRGAVRKLGSEMMKGAAVVIGGVAIFYGVGEMLTKAGQATGLVPATTCGNVSPRALGTVDRLLAAPPARGEARDPSHFNLTMYPDTRPIVRAIRQVDTSTPTGSRTLLKETNSFTRHYGVAVEVVDAKTAESEHVELPSAKRLASPRTKANMEAIVKGLAGLPVEYVRYAGTQKILLYYSTDKSDSTGGSQAYVDVADGHVKHAIMYNLSGVGDDYVTPHEIYHEIDAKECGKYATDDDPHFTALNPGDIYRQGHSGHLAYETAVDRYTKLGDSMHQALYDGDERSYCRSYRTWRRIGARVVSETNYSFKDGAEDKAEIGAEFSQPQYFNGDLDPLQPVLTHKFKFLLARLYEHQPNYVRYLAAVSTRPDSRHFPSQC